MKSTPSCTANAELSMPDVYRPLWRSIVSKCQSLFCVISTCFHSPSATYKHQATQTTSVSLYHVQFITEWNNLNKKNRASFLTEVRVTRHEVQRAADLAGPTDWLTYLHVGYSLRTYNCDNWTRRLKIPKMSSNRRKRKIRSILRQKQHTYTYRIIINKKFNNNK